VGHSSFPSYLLLRGLHDGFHGEAEVPSASPSAGADAPNDRIPTIAPGAARVPLPPERPAHLHTHAGPSRSAEITPVAVSLVLLLEQLPTTAGSPRRALMPSPASFFRGIGAERQFATGADDQHVRVRHVVQGVAALCQPPTPGRTSCGRASAAPDASCT